MTVWQIDFYANEYADEHLAPDSWEVETETDAELTRVALDRIAERIGHPRGLVRLADDNSDFPDVEICDRIGGEWIKRGEVHFIDFPQEVA